MSTLWTPGGEVPVGRGTSEHEKKGKATPQGAKAEGSAAGEDASTRREASRASDNRGTGQASDDRGTGQASDDRGTGQASDDTQATTAAEERVEQLREQLLATPAAVVVANHAYGLFELAAIHLSASPPNLEEARLATDAMGALVEGLAGRLGEAESSLKDALAQLRLAFVQVSAARASAQ